MIVAVLIVETNPVFRIFTLISNSYYAMQACIWVNFLNFGGTRYVLLDEQTFLETLVA